MKSAPIDDPFFQGKAQLLVEDPLTAVVLQQCWLEDPRARQIVVRAVGGRESVNRLVQAAREQKKTTVFGFVDRDFGPVRMGPDVYSTDRHEIENELLDSRVIAELSGRSETDIDRALETEAQKLVDWMGVRYLLQHRKKAPPSFPSDPKIADASKQWIENTASAYCERVKRYANDEIPSAWRDTWDKTHRVQAEDEAKQGRWRTEFSGKELFAALAVSISGPRYTGTVEDRARAIAVRWRKQPLLSTPPVPACIQRVRDQIVTVCRL